MYDERRIHRVEAGAGSVLLFGESLFGSTSPIRSDRARLILVSGCTSPMLRDRVGNEVSPEFVTNLPKKNRPLISGSENWGNWLGKSAQHRCSCIAKFDTRALPARDLAFLPGCGMFPLERK